ncbi:HGGxSTG domain-containing protein [Mesorhizobium newzealandense]|uniref:HGGxSTG domain-containing protein n=1 Tax=Mesorhizobium newzealandense TaxID=1300302 RepID=A0ABW4U5M1_9HYPH
MKRAGTPERPGGWRGSAAQIAVGRASIMRWNSIRHLQPRCGAARKRDGEPCQNLAMGNGRCRCHGGRTPKGDGYHLPVWPDGKAPGAMTKLNKKLNALDRAAAKRAKRIAAFTPEQRQRYDAWRRTHKPGPAAVRDRAKAERQQAASVRKMLSESRPETAPSDEQAELERLLADRKAELARAIAKKQTNDPGAFG